MKVCLACESRFEGASWRCPSCGAAPAGNGVPLFAPDLAHSDDTFDERVFDRLARQEETSFWFHSRNRLIGWALSRYAPAARSFLEIGCGTGFVLRGLRERFPCVRLVGSELLTGGLAIARRRVPDASLLQLDARRVPFDGEFDAAGAFDVIEHIDEDGEVLAQLRQAVRPGGTVLVTVPQHAWLWSQADEYARHRRRYSRDELTEKMERAGLTVLRTTSFVTILLPAMTVSRMRGRRTDSYDPAAELRASGRARVPFDVAMRVEEALIARGLSLPAGGSLLAVGRRPE